MNDKIRTIRIRFHHTAAEFAMRPISYKQQFFTCLRKSLQNHLDIVFGFDSTQCHSVFTGNQSEIGQYVLLNDRYVAKHMISSVLDHYGLFSVLVTHIILYPLIIGDNHIGIFYGGGFGPFQKFPNIIFPLGAPMLQSVDIDNDALFIE